MSQKDLILLNKIWSSLFNNGFKMTVIFCSVKMEREHLTGISFPEKLATPYTLTYVSSTCEYHRAKLQLMYCVKCGNDISQKVPFHTLNVP